MELRLPDNVIGKTLGVACSGGGDSVALLHAVLSRAKKDGYKVVCLNVEHGLRGDASKKDSAFVKTLAESLGVPFYGFTVDTPARVKETGETTEEAARNLRYGALKSAIKNGLCDFVLTAHHAGDDVESALLHLFRGCSLKGLTGIPWESDGVLRPMLDVKKSEIEEYLKENGLPFVQDETNADVRFTRNAVRHRVLPAVKEVFPQAEDAVKRLMRLAKDEDAYLDGLAKTALKAGKDGSYSVPADTPTVLLRRAAVCALHALGEEKDYTCSSVSSVTGLATMQSGRAVDLTGGVKAVKEGERIVFYKTPETDEEPTPFFLGEKTVGGGRLTATLLKNDKAFDLKSGKFLDYAKIPKTAVWRYPKAGDRFFPAGGHQKTLKAYETNKKTPSRVKRQTLVLADGENVLFLSDFTVSDLVKVDKATAFVVQLDYQK